MYSSIVLIRYFIKHINTANIINNFMTYRLLKPILFIIGVVKNKGIDPRKYISFRNKSFSFITHNKIAKGIRNQQKRVKVSNKLSVNRIGSDKIIDPWVSIFIKTSRTSYTKSIEKKNNSSIGVPKSSFPVIFFKWSPLVQR